MKKSFTSFLVNILLPVLVCSITWILIDRFWGITVSPYPRFLDAAVFTAFSVLFSLITRNKLLHAAVVSMIVVSFYFASAIKIKMLGSGVRLEDISLLYALFDILEGWRRYLFSSLLLCVIVLFIAAISFGRLKRIAVVCISGFLFFSLPIIAPQTIISVSESVSSEKIWNEKRMFETNGFWLYLFLHRAKMAIAVVSPPTRDEVEKIFASREIHEIRSDEFKPRNIHIILAESFWDPAKFSDISFDRDPFYSPFRELVEAGESSVLVPVFGGKTANSEFEVLCGLSSASEIIEFSILEKSIPCLPYVLGSFGYTSMVSHPNKKEFWNRANAYNALSFDVFNTIDSFLSSDVNYGTFISDESLYQRVQELLEEIETPFLNYVVTISGHYPYGLDEKKRPSIISADPKDAEIEAYANNVYYSSKEAYEYILAIQEHDPDALIVFFGDHLPVFDSGMELYSKFGYLLNDNSNFTLGDFRKYLTTPLLMLDRGEVVSTGTIPLYEVPFMILERVIGKRQILPGDIGVSPKPGADKNILRPLDSGVLLNDQRICLFGEGDKPGACSPILKEFHKLSQIKSDLLKGEQFSLNHIPVAKDISLSRSMKIDPFMLPCEVSVREIGPPVVQKGQPFNIQSNGESSLWLIDVAYNRNPWISIDGQFFNVVGDEEVLTASHQDPSFVHTEGVHEIKMGCGKDSMQTVGLITVE